MKKIRQAAEKGNLPALFSLLLMSRKNNFPNLLETVQKCLKSAKLMKIRPPKIMALLNGYITYDRKKAEVEGKEKTPFRPFLDETEAKGSEKICSECEEEATHVSYNAAGFGLTLLCEGCLPEEPVTGEPVVEEPVTEEEEEIPDEVHEIEVGQKWGQKGKVFVVLEVGEKVTLDPEGSGRKRTILKSTVLKNYEYISSEE